MKPVIDILLYGLLISVTVYTLYRVGDFIDHLV